MEKYVEEHADEISEYNKTVRYLKANQMNPNAQEEYVARCNALLKEIPQNEGKFQAHALKRWRSRILFLASALRKGFWLFLAMNTVGNADRIRIADMPSRFARAYFQNLVSH